MRKLNLLLFEEEAKVVEKSKIMRYPTATRVLNSKEYANMLEGFFAAYPGKKELSDLLDSNAYASSTGRTFSTSVSLSESSYATLEMRAKQLCCSKIALLRAAIHHRAGELGINLYNTGRLSKLSDISNSASRAEELIDSILEKHRSILHELAELQDIIKKGGIQNA